MMPKLFVSYAREDIDAAKRVISALRHFSIDVWFDRDILLPGQDWKHEILKAIKSCDYFLVLLSNHSVRKNGVIQKEIREAIEQAELRPIGTVFIIPDRLDPVTPSFEQLQSLHWVDLFENWDDSIEKIATVVGAYNKTPFDTVSALEAMSLIRRSLDYLNSLSGFKISVIVVTESDAETALFYCDRYAFERSVEDIIANLRHGKRRESDGLIGDVTLAATSKEFSITVRNEISVPFPPERIKRNVSSAMAERGGIDINYEVASTVFVAKLTMAKVEHKGG